MFLTCRYGKVFRTNILGKPIIVSTDPDVNKAVLQNHGNVFIPSYPKSVTELLGKSSILQTNGPLQKRLHSLIGGYFRSPQFKSRIAREIEDYVKVSLSTWEHKKLPILVQDETKQVIWPAWSILKFIYMWKLFYNGNLNADWNLLIPNMQILVFLTCVCVCIFHCFCLYIFAWFSSQIPNKYMKMFIPRNVWY